MLVLRWSDGISHLRHPPALLRGDFVDSLRILFAVHPRTLGFLMLCTQICVMLLLIYMCIHVFVFLRRRIYAMHSFFNYTCVVLLT
jgi:hypothetical protein